MNFAGNLLMNLYSMTILIILFLQLKKQDTKDSLEYKLYKMMIQTTFLLITIDILSRIDSRKGIIYYYFNHFGNFMIFALNLVIPSLWLLYVYMQVYQEDVRMRRLFYGLVVLNIINIGMVIASQFKGWLYYFDAKGVYHRGVFYAIPVITTVILITLSYKIIIQNRKRIERKQVFTLAFFAVLPCAGILLQILFLGISLILNFLVLSFLLVFLNIQNYNIYTDYLTGVYNRKKFDLFLGEKIKAITENKTFSAILLDVNDFKKVNDTYGHIIGDQALRMSTRLLGSCLGVNDFIARVGGDEFCVILDTSKQSELEDTVHRIKKCFATYNETKNQPYELCFSMGYAVYDFHKAMKMEEFFKELDDLMYKNKQGKKYNPKMVLITD